MATGSQRTVFRPAAALRARADRDRAGGPRAAPGRHGDPGDLGVLRLASSESLLTTTAQWARRLGVPLRIATLGVRGGTMFPPEVGLRAEDQVLDAWREQTADAQAAAVSLLAARGLKPDETVVAVGSGWAEAMDRLSWEDGEIMVLGSSSAGPIARVFLGSRATRLIRHSPVPVVVVPAGEVAEDALAAGPAPTPAAG